MNSYLVVVCFQLGYSLCMLAMVLPNNTVLHLKGELRPDIFFEKFSWKSKITSI